MINNIEFEQSQSLANNLPQIIKDLEQEGFPIQIKMEGLNIYFTIQDFYKTKELILIINKNNNVVAFDKEGNKGVVDSIDKIVSLNYYWWINSQTIKHGYPQLNKFWTDQFLKKKWLVKTYHYDPDIDSYKKYLEEEKENNIKDEEIVDEEIKIEKETEKTEENDDFQL